MAITRDQALTIDLIHADGCTRTIGARGSVREHSEEWRRNGATQTWKTRPADFRFPVKYGLHRYGQITPANADWFHTPDACPLRVPGPIGASHTRDARRARAERDHLRQAGNASPIGSFPGKGLRLIDASKIRKADARLLARYQAGAPLPRLAPPGYGGPAAPTECFYQTLGYRAGGSLFKYGLEAGDRVQVAGTLIGNIAALWGESAYVFLSDTYGRWVARDLVTRAPRGC